VHEKQTVAEMAGEILARQAKARAERTGEPVEEALGSVAETEAGRQLGELGDGPHREESAAGWQEGLPLERAEERRSQALQEERARTREKDLARERLAAWESFMRAERLELKLRREGQLAGLLGEPLAGESPEALRRLALEDRRQAEEGLVALMKDGKVFYKPLEELVEADRPARVAANRLRTGWLKERRDGWLGPTGFRP